MQPQPNRLIHENSPYLQQHAYNPVNWYPWGKEAFDKAKTEGKPIFLSIGYSTCHWCHAMAHDTFENEEIAKMLNDNYVSIKVDREERPDIDAAYVLKWIGDATNKPSWQHAYELQQRYLSGNMEEYPINHSFSLLTFFE